MKNLILIAALAATTATFAQKLSDDFTVTVSQPYQVIDAPNKQYFTTKDGDVISIKSRGEIVSIQKFDSESMSEEGRNVYEDFPKGTNIQRIIETKAGLFYLSEAYDKSEKAFKLYSRKVNTDDYSFSKLNTMFTTSKKVTKGEMNAYGRYPNMMSTPKMSGMTGLVNGGTNFTIYQSYDKSKTLVQYRLKPTEKRDAVNKDILGFHVYDENMNKIWGEEVEMPHTEKEMNNLAYTVGSDGTVYMISYLNESKELELIKVTNDGNLTNHVLSVDGTISFGRLLLVEGSDGNFMCSGYYANGYEFKYTFGGGSVAFNADGVYSFKLTADGEVSDTWKIAFPLEIVQQYLNDKQREKLEEREKEGKAGIMDLIMSEFIPQPDGSFIVVGEQKYIRNEWYGTGTTNLAHFSNVVVMKISKSGELIWITKIPKNQVLVLGDSIDPFAEGQLSIRYVQGKDAHYVLFVDNPKNENLPENKVPEDHKNGLGGYITAYKVNDSDGAAERHTVADLNNIKGQKAYQLSITRICGTQSGTFLMEIYKKGKEDAMVKMELAN